MRSEQEAQPKPGVRGESEYCDALISLTRKLLLAVKTADCVPVLIGDAKTGAFAAIHAGWRGCSSSIVTRAIEQLQHEYQTKPADLRAAIGPAANVCCYEVGPEVIAQFKERCASPDSLFRPTHDGHAHIDLQTANRDQLVSAGVAPEKIHVAPLCTMERTDLFFSYRREKALHGRVGRLMSVIGRRHAS